MNTAQAPKGKGGDAFRGATLSYSKTPQFATERLADAMDNWRGHYARAVRIEAVARSIEDVGGPAADREAARQRAWGRCYQHEALVEAVTAILAWRAEDVR